MNEKLTDNVIVIQPPSRFVYLGVIFFFSLCFISFAVFVKFDDVRSADGFIAQSRGVYKIYSPIGGKINSLMISKGDQVRPGDKLFQLTNDNAELSTGESLSGSLLQEVANQTATGEGMIQTAKTIGEIALQKNKIERVDLAREKAGLQNKLEVFLEKLKAKEKIRESINKNEYQGIISSIDRDRLDDEYLKIKIESMSVINDIDKINRQLARLELDVSKITSDSRRDEQKIEMEISDIKKKNFNELSGHELLIKAPVSGKVSSVLKRSGNDVAEKDLVLILTPEDSVFEAQLIIPNHVIGFIKVGNPVAIRYYAYPYQLFGTQKGKISEIDDQLLMPGETSSLPMTINYPFYLAKVKLDKQSIALKGISYELKSGMHFKAEIQINEISVLDWMLQPFFN